MSKIKINIVSSSEEIYSGEATMVFATGSLGELGIAPGHTLIDRFSTWASKSAERMMKRPFFALVDLEVQPDLITVLSDTAERAESLDESEAIKAKEVAEKELANKDATIDSQKHPLSYRSSC